VGGLGIGEGKKDHNLEMGRGIGEDRFWLGRI